MAQEEAEVEAAAARLRTALALFDDGVELYRQNIRRRHPELGAEEVAARVRAWLRTRPGAVHGDSDGTPRLRGEL